MALSSREKEINVLIEECKKDALEQNRPLERRGIEVMGEKQILDVYRLPIGALRYNLRNGRFAAELKEMEARLGRKLDTNNPEDAKIIKTILLEQNREETDYLKKDLKKKGQIDPGLVTYDGYVINGNRRMAIFEVLYEETKNPRFEYLEVQVLPRSVSSRDLWRIEAGLQLSRDKRLDYSPINQLLKLQEGIQAGLTPEEIAKSYYGKVTEKIIRTDIKRLKLIEEYLNYIGKPYQYKLAEGYHEHFINLQTQISKLEKKGLNESEINDAITLGYEIILGGIKHMDVRKLARTLLSDRAKKIITDAITENQSEGEVDEEELDYLDEDIDNDEVEEIEEQIKPEPISMDSLEFSQKKGRAKRIIGDYQHALDVLVLEKDREKPYLLIKKAFDALDSIDLDSEHIYRKEVKKAIKDLAIKVNEILGYIEKK